MSTTAASWGKPRRRHRLPIALALSIALGLAPRLFAAAKTEPTELRLEARVGLGGMVRYGHWTPVAVRLAYDPAVPGETLRGDLRLLPETGNAACYRRPLVLGAGRKRLTLYGVAEEPWPLFGRKAAVAVHDRTGQARIRTAPLPPGAGSDWLDTPVAAVAVLAEEDRFDLAGWLRRQRASAASFRLGHLRAARAYRVDPEDAPDRWIGYAAADVVVVDRPRPTMLRPVQFEALREWVRQGGRLAFVFAVHDPPGRLGPWEALLPAKTEGVVSLPLELEEGTEKKKEEEVRLRWPGMLADACRGATCRTLEEAGGYPFRVETGETRPVTLLRAEPREGARIRLGTAETPLLVTRTVGLGETRLLTVDPAAWPLKGHALRLALLGRAWGVVFEEAEIDALAEATMSRDEWIRDSSITPYEALAGPAAGVLETLRDAPELEPLPLVWVGLFLAAYLLAAAPFDCWLVNRLGRRSLTWLTLPALIALFAAVAYGLPSAGRRSTGTVERSVTVLDAAAGEDRAEVRRFVGVFSPRGGVHDLDFGPGMFPFALAAYAPESVPVDGRGTGGIPFRPLGSDVTVTVAERGVARGVSILPWTMEVFAARGRVDDPAPVEGDLHYVGRHLTGALRVRSASPLRDAVLVGRYGVYDLGTLAPGTVWRPDAERARSFSHYLADAAYAYEVRLHTLYGSVDLGEADPELAFQAMSLQALVEGFSLRHRIQRAQAAPAGGLSIAQVWSARRRLFSMLMGDRSDAIRRGGLLLFARIDAPWGEPAASGDVLLREGEMRLRVVFPPGPETEGGAPRGDDLYGEPDEGLWERHRS